jgi:hypothetical protein
MKIALSSWLFKKKSRNVTSGYALNEPVHNLTIRINNFVPPPKLTGVEKQHEEEFLDSFFRFFSSVFLFT